MHIPSIARAASIGISGLLLGMAAQAANHATVFSQADVPQAIQVPAGHAVAWETVGVGEITYECRASADASAGAAWAFAGPKAVLNDRHGQPVGQYWGPPATWEANDGSSLTGKELATAPAGEGNLPYQLVQANPAEGAGALEGVAYIQRVALTGGVAPTQPACTKDTIGAKELVPYQADYIFWKAS